MLYSFEIYYSQIKVIHFRIFIKYEPFRLGVTEDLQVLTLSFISFNKGLFHFIFKYKYVSFIIKTVFIKINSQETINLDNTYMEYPTTLCYH